MNLMNKQVLLANRPKGWVQESDFRIVETPVPTIESGKVLVRNFYLSLDPYMRGRMDDAKSYAAKVELGDVMVGGTVGEVIESQNEKFSLGDKVLSSFGWQQYGISEGTGLYKVDTQHVPLSAYLGPAGMPGVTAWIGLFDIGAPKPGETIVVSSAAGAVGGIAGQLAKGAGCRVVGIAGGPAKCEYVVKELGFDACVDYKLPTFKRDIKLTTPDGVDVYFENVGGVVFDMVFRRLNNHARIVVCGLISQYNNPEPRPLPDPRFFLVKRIRLEGFIVSDRMDRWPEALNQLRPGVAEGRIKYRETIAEGLDNAPRAFIGMLKGGNIGKQLVKLF